MSEESITSSRRPIASLKEYKPWNAKRVKDYYHRNHDGEKMTERAQCKRGQLQERVKTVIANWWTSPSLS
jgi:hypothetical protein